MPTRLVLLVLLALPSTLNAQQCLTTPQNRVVNVRVTMVCPGAKTSAGVTCGSTISSVDVEKALSGASRLLQPLCLTLIGGVSEDLEHQASVAKWRPQDSIDIFKKRQNPSWSTADIFVIGRFGAPSTNKKGNVLRIPYRMRTVQVSTIANKLKDYPLVEDGIVITKKDFEPDTVAHEIGHWLSILHPTQNWDDPAGPKKNECSLINDHIDDTAAQGPADASDYDVFGCEGYKLSVKLKKLKKNSCSVPLTSAVTSVILGNMMLYTDCRDRFTGDQTSTMLEVWDRRRMKGTTP
jgi:hypothetical protein